MIRWLRLGFLAVFLYPFNGNAGKVEIDVQHVGQGNCVLVKFSPDDESSKYMLVDIGSSSYKTEMSLANKKMKATSKEEKKNALENKIGESKVSSSPISDQRSSSLPGNSSSISAEESGKPTTEEKSHEDIFIENLRKELGQKEIPSQTLKRRKGEEDKKQPISIQTVVITHPDKDHYGWLATLFTEKKDQIKHIIFGGLPEHYDVSGAMKFKDWIEGRLQENTKIYFPAISYAPIKSLDEVYPHPGRSYAPHRYSVPKAGLEELTEAFNFGKEFAVYMLSVNPSHFEENGEILHFSNPEDDNVDSLVLKIENKEVSAILTGDATGLTTTRIMNNYRNHPEFLKTNVLLASHHGSSTHGSNNEAWIRATQPEIVLISNGLSQGHPHEEAYETFKRSPRLMKAVPVEGVSKRHEVFTPDGRREKGCTVHATKRGIFSTVTSYGMMVELDEKGIVNLATRKEGRFKLDALPVEENEEEIIEAHPEEREGHLVLVSSSQGHSSGEDQEIKSADIGAASSASPEEEVQKQSRKITDTVGGQVETSESPEKSASKRQKMGEESSEKQSD